MWSPNSLCKKAPEHTGLTCYIDSNKVAHSSKDSILYFGPALIMAAVWLVDFLNFQKQRGRDFRLGVWASWEVQAFYLLSKPSLVLLHCFFIPVSLNFWRLILLMPDEATQIQGPSFFQVFRGRWINDFQHTVFCGGREQTLTELTFVPGQLPLPSQDSSICLCTVKSGAIWCSRHAQSTQDKRYYNKNSTFSLMWEEEKSLFPIIDLAKALCKQNILYKLCCFHQNGRWEERLFFQKESKSSRGEGYLEGVGGLVFSLQLCPWRFLLSSNIELFHGKII